MYFAKPGLIIGFHGSDLSICENLVSGKITLRPSSNSYDWLGNGIYFWENYQQRALDFALELKERSNRHSKIKIPAVVGAVIDMGFCLDLLDTEYIRLIGESYKALSLSCKSFNFPMPTNSNIGSSTDLLLRNLDCAVIENLHKRRFISGLRSFDSVRGAFREGPELKDIFYPAFQIMNGIFHKQKKGRFFRNSLLHYSLRSLNTWN